MFHPTQKTPLLHIFLAGRRDPDLLPQSHSMVGNGCKIPVSSKHSPSPYTEEDLKSTF